MIKKILLLVAFIVVFAAGVVIASILHFGSPIVNIEFINESGKDIKAISIIHKTGRYGDIYHQILDLGIGKQRQFKMWVPSESSYELIITFGDKQQLIGGQGYIEPGYKIKETINSNKIESSVALKEYRP